MKMSATTPISVYQRRLAVGSWHGFAKAEAT
jgi:hypothetical protein